MQGFWSQKYPWRDQSTYNNAPCWRCDQLEHHRSDSRQNAQANLVDATHTGYGTFGKQEDLEDFLTLNTFMNSANSSAQFPFGDTKAFMSVDSNCSRYMTGFYKLLDIKPCDIT